MAENGLQAGSRRQPLTLVFGADREIAYWVGEGLGLDFRHNPRAIGIADSGHLIAGVVYTNYSGIDIQMSIHSASPRWATRRTLYGLFAYPFEQLGCRRVSALTLQGNQSTRTFLQRLGFTHEGNHPEALPGGDAVSYGMLRRDCKWLRNGKKL